MVSITLSIGEFHPAVESAIRTICEDGPTTDSVIQTAYERVEATINDSRERWDITSKIKDSAVKGSKDRKVTLTGKVAGIVFPNTPAGILGRVNNYLQESREVFLRVETVELPASVAGWISDLNKTAKAKVEKAEKVLA